MTTPKCPECERRERDREVEGDMFAGCAAGSMAGMMVGAPLAWVLGNPAGVLCVVIGASVGVILFWRRALRRQAEQRRKRP